MSGKTEIKKMERERLWVNGCFKSPLQFSFRECNLWLKLETPSFTKSGLESLQLLFHQASTAVTLQVRVMFGHEEQDDGSDEQWPSRLVRIVLVTHSWGARLQNFPNWRKAIFRIDWVQCLFGAVFSHLSIHEAWSSDILRCSCDAQTEFSLQKCRNCIPCISRLTNKSTPWKWWCINVHLSWFLRCKCSMCYYVLLHNDNFCQPQFSQVISNYSHLRCSHCTHRQQTWLATSVLAKDVRLPASEAIQCADGQGWSSLRTVGGWISPSQVTSTGF